MPRRALLVLALTAAVAAPLASDAPAGIGDARCDGRLPTVTAADQIREDQDARRLLGLPTSRAHVAALRRSRAARRRGTALDTIPLSRVEARFVRARFHIERLERRAAAFVRRGAAGTYAGVNADGRFPGRPFLAVHLTRPAPRLERALAARLDVPVRVMQARHTLHALGRVQARIERDSGSLKALGIRWTGLGIDVAHNRLDVDVIAARADVRTVMARRYGDAVHVTVIARRPDRLVCVSVESYTPAAAGRSLVVHYATGPENAFVRAFVAETPTTVRVGVIERRPNGPVLEVGVTRDAAIALAAPLAARAVLDAETGRRLPLAP